MRLLIDPPQDGPTNMGRDEALLREVGAGSSPPTLRFYQWDPPTISLGYFQKYDQYAALPPPARRLAVVRRTTGGGAILHDREWTYSIVVPVTASWVQGRATRLYELIHDALIDVLQEYHVPGVRRCGLSDDSAAHRGPFFCFDRRHCLDVVIGSDKLAGSAQRRTAAAILQHGSIMLQRRYEQQSCAALADYSFVSPEDLIRPLVRAVQRRLGVHLQDGRWSEHELTAAAELADKHRSPEWLRRA